MESDPKEIAFIFQFFSGTTSLWLFMANDHRTTLLRVAVSALPLLLVLVAPWFYDLLVWNLRMAETLR